MQFSKIEKIEPSPYKGVVHNIEVEEDNSYVANGLVVHNCEPSAGADILFDRSCLDRQAKKDPLKVVGGFKIFHKFDPSHRYGSGHDVAGGVGLDSSTSVFIDFSTLPPRVVATFKDNQIKPDIFGDEIEREASMYGKPIVAPESNNHGHATIGRLKQIYDNIYFTEQKQTRVGLPPRVREYGWNTNAMTKPKMLFDLKKAVEDGHLELSDPDLIAELRSYTRDDLMDKDEDVRLTTRHFDLLVACFIKGTLILTDKGQVPIESVNIGDLVMTRDGYKKVKKTLSHVKKVINNIGLTGTHDHPVFFGDNQTKNLSCITADDILYKWDSNLQKIERLSYTEMLHTTGIQMQNGEHTGHITLAEQGGKFPQNIYIGRFGKITSALFQKVLLFITKMATQTITALKILICYPFRNTCCYICKIRGENNNSSKISKKIGIKSIRAYWNIGKTKLQESLSVLTVVNHSGLSPTMQSFAIERVHTDIEEKRRKNLNRKRCATFARKSLKREYHTSEDVQKSAIDCEEENNYRRVYNLEVEGTPEYFANGVLVHNCAIAHQMRNWAEVKKESANTFVQGPYERSGLEE